MVKKDKFDRLLDLIQNGKTTAIKKAAAVQIGFLQDEFSYDLSTILHKLYPLLLYHDFSCRQAAATALENLIPRCRQQKTAWKTTRPLMKLKDFNSSRILSSGNFLTHCLTFHDADADDYKDQVFEVNQDPDNQVGELCQISELMINKLNSANWFYRHGAVLCLLAIIRPGIPKDYLEDLAVRLLGLISLDRFKDYSHTTVQVPVVDPACHLLARCLMSHISESIPILEQFHSYKTDSDEDDGWSLRFSFWNIIQHMIMIDRTCLNPEWIEKSLFETLQDNGDDNQEEVVAAAIDSIIPIVDLLPHPDNCANEIYLSIFENDDDISSTNTPSTKALEAFIQQCDITSFIDDDTFDHLISHCQYPQSSTRSATYSLFITIFNKHGLDIFNGFDYLPLLLKLISILLNETLDELFREGIEILPALKEIMLIKNVVFNETYVTNVMDSMANDIRKMTKIIPIIMKISDICEINPVNPVFPRCQTVWGIAFCIILCLNKDTPQPIFQIDNSSIFTKDPINLLLSLFSLEPKDVPDKIPQIAGLPYSLALFVCKYLGRMIKDLKNDDIINQLIQRNAEYEEALLTQYFGNKLPDEEIITNSYQTIINHPNNKKPKPILYAQLIATNAVFKYPVQLDTVFNILQLIYCVQAKVQMPLSTIDLLLHALRKNPPQLASMLAYGANLYSQINPAAILSPFVDRIDRMTNLTQGPIEFIDLFLTDFDTSKLDLLSWCSFFVKPCLQNFANQNDFLRRMAAHSLAQIVRLLPLDNGNCDSLPSELHELKGETMKYLAPLFDITKAPDYALIPPPSFDFMEGKGQIRSYQRDGINWLGFLYQYGLNGILADDMGLGKTFQCLCSISNAHAKEFISSGTISEQDFLSGQIQYHQLNTNEAPLSIVICPPSVITHWCRESKNFFPWIPVHSFVDKTDINKGNFLSYHGILVTSYNLVRSCLDCFLEFQKHRSFMYCVLDEGHVIKNMKSKIAEAIMGLKARHRLILSGTPIQNNVAELWSLMDFLMPGYLGTKQVFHQKYEKWIKEMFKPDASEQKTEKGQAVLQQLHLQVLPFIMRRLRSAVLEELPPRVLFDEVFQMTDVQRQIHDQLVHKSEAVQCEGGIPTAIDIDENVFTKMIKERDLCIHPSLVDPSIPREIEYSAKLMELKRILLTQLGLGGGKDQMRNRALLFARRSNVLDIVREIVLDPLKQDISYAILDGRIRDKDRPAVIDNFNREDGPDLLLLTETIGGLGLNLQVANNVIFLENSYNFTEDEQAVARAHRMGQKRTVTVFYLITEGTIEQRILDIQQKKRNMVNTIINEQNEQSVRDLDALRDHLDTKEDTQKQDQNDNVKMTNIDKVYERLDVNEKEYVRSYTDDNAWKNTQHD